MALVKRVICHTERTCGICNKPVRIGREAVKDRRLRRKTGKTTYSHLACFEAKKAD